VHEVGYVRSSLLHLQEPAKGPYPEQCLHYTFMEVQEVRQILKYCEAFCKYLYILDVPHNCDPH
jgi:hypothetical protein